MESSKGYDRSVSLGALARAHESASARTLSEGTIVDLIREEGIAIRTGRGIDPVIQLRPLDFTLHHSLRTPLHHLDDVGSDGPQGYSDPPIPPIRPQFESSEHVIIVQGCNLQFPDGPRNAGTTFLGLPNGLHLTYGQVVALGGDFYGDPERPICKASDTSAQQAQFIANYRSLAETCMAQADVANILSILQSEFAAIAVAINKGQQPSAAYAHMGDELSRRWNDATNGRYLALAKTNFDHFGQDALTAYLAGHTVASRMAAAAHFESDPAKRSLLLGQAYAANAFADHFLTDLFSAGHRRTPRRRLYEDESGTNVYVPGEGWFSPQDLASLLARGMHDEDNRFGVWATNARGDRWVTYGDKRFRDKANYPNLLLVRQACQASMDDIWAAFQQGQVPASFSVLAYVPKLEVDASDLQNWSPLFRLNNGKVERRNDVASRSDYTWKDDWWLVPTAVLMYKAGLISFGWVPADGGATGETGFPPKGPSGATGRDLSYLPPYGQWPTAGVGGPSGQRAQRT
jgi:hypothetical protein